MKIFLQQQYRNSTQRYIVKCQNENIRYSVVEIEKVVGFGNVANTLTGDKAELIYSIAGEYKNRADGSFLASKLISEFGIFGFFDSSLY